MFACIDRHFLQGTVRIVQHEPSHAFSRKFISGHFRAMEQMNALTISSHGDISHAFGKHLSALSKSSPPKLHPAFHIKRHAGENMKAGSQLRE